eukprot:CAMPEP_0119295914 /NCGR_PEP_ID=MMETSP1329-20130426/50304_1 /TAXON_ID=114041 /ORGANISM="Genus nov. species nov., Strain RCC1024" /LENGTH=212 /DNA_ID=CAMNT_0007296837 /DNA_START=512 /DNA_END=1151 /DNA_ORIENTATION=+
MHKSTRSYAIRAWARTTRARKIASSAFMSAGRSARRREASQHHARIPASVANQASAAAAQCKEREPVLTHLETAMSEALRGYQPQQPRGPDSWHQVGAAHHGGCGGQPQAGHRAQLPVPEEQERAHEADIDAVPESLTKNQLVATAACLYQSPVLLRPAQRHQQRGQQRILPMQRASSEHTENGHLPLEHLAIWQNQSLQEWQQLIVNVALQ